MFEVFTDLAKLLRKEYPKVGIDAVKFEKYLTNIILPSYPNAMDVQLKHAAIIVDSGPGRLNLEMLEKLSIHGFYLITGVPNTTHITHATQRN